MMDVERSCHCLRLMLPLALTLLSSAASAADTVMWQQPAAEARPATRRMTDGKEWTTQNLSIDGVSSFCYADDPGTCRRYGRLYTWDDAAPACRLLGTGWRLPTDADWRQLANRYGALPGADGRLGAEAYAALMAGGRSGFDAVLGGGRSGEGEYARLDAHGFYWTATEVDSALAIFYNFGKGSGGLYRQNQGEKVRAFAVRCVRD